VLVAWAASTAWPLRDIPGATLAAIADPTPGQAARLAAELGVDKVYTDPQQLLDDPDIDGVLIAAPPAATPNW
jgi:myo-inositol 2-dehydrogenase/D-chiro-inositol 1-dehydrogenase